MPNCDFGSPCNCRECTEIYFREICDICNYNNTIKTYSHDEVDRKGSRYYEFTNYCQSCWDKKQKNDFINMQKTQVKKNLIDEKRRKMQERLKELDYFPIPIKIAVAKYREQRKIWNSDNWIQKHLIRDFKNDLIIEKKKNRWYCCKNRLGIIDFNLYYYI